MWAVNFCFARLAFAPFYQGYRPAALVRDEFLDLAPAVLGMLVVGVVSAVLVDAFGVVALAPLAAVIVVPQIALERIARAESAARLARTDAMRLYTAAIVDVLDLSRDERRELACAAELVQPADDPHHRTPSSTGATPTSRGSPSSPCTRTSAGPAVAGRRGCRPRRSRGAAGSSPSPAPGPG